MSIDEIERTVPMRSDQLFSHSEFVRAQIDSFEEAFVHNERFKEFEGLLKTNHRIYECLEAKFDHQNNEKLNTLTSGLRNLAEQLQNIGQSHFTKDALDAMDLVEKPMSEIVRLAEQKHREIEERRRRSESEDH